jgi:hypothetical protein
MTKFIRCTREQGHTRVLIWVTLAGLAACGKPATVEDCEHIMARITELEMKAANVSNPASIQAQVERTKQMFHSAAQGECVGRRLSQATRDCVDQAQSARQIVEECFR